MPQMAPINWNMTSMLSFSYIILLMTNLVFPMSKMLKQKKKLMTNNLILMW